MAQNNVVWHNLSVLIEKKLQGMILLGMTRNTFMPLLQKALANATDKFKHNITGFRQLRADDGHLTWFCCCLDEVRWELTTHWQRINSSCLPLFTLVDAARPGVW
jgi:hypothetical protein